MPEADNHKNPEQKGIGELVFTAPQTNTCKIRGQHAKKEASINSKKLRLYSASSINKAWAGSAHSVPQEQEPIAHSNSLRPYGMAKPEQ